jgi:anaerobic ribonucleoside-triphosphate reductase activating protein
MSKMDKDYFLNIAMTMSRSRANGPGERAVIWVQGCTIGCPGCYNNFTHPHQLEKIASAKELANWVGSIENIEGITFSGGEPFEQSEAISQVIKIINQNRQKPLSVFIFTGFEYDFLKASSNEAVKNLLSLTDILSAGPYIASQRNPDLLWRGSINQELVYLTDCYSSIDEKKWIEESPIEELVFQNNDITRTGFLGIKGNLYQSILNLR